jgi:hypothetical protein
MSESSDKQLGDYLAGASGLSRAYRDSAMSRASEQPPAQMDAAIQAAARREVSARPALARPPRWRAWYVPLSAAAVVVLASLLVLRVSQAPEGKPAAQQAARAPVLTPRVATAPVAPEAAQTEADSSAPAAPAKGAGSGDDTQAKSAASPAQAKTTAAAADPSQRRQRSVEKRTAAKPPAAAKPDAAHTPARASPSNAEATPPMAQEQQRTPQDSAGAVAQGKTREVLADAPADSAASSSSAQSPAAAPAQLARRAEQPAGTPRAQARLDEADLQRDPNRWLEHIVELQRDGKTEEMQRALRLFKQRYALHALPRELAAAWAALRAAEAGANEAAKP